MNQLLKTLLAVCLLTPILTFADDLQINGVAAFEQLRKEYYIGALYLPVPAHDSAAVTGASGDKRMVLHITADRWSPMQFAQHWNQMILINNGGSTLNANVMDVLNFTGALKGDLIAGDELTFETNNSGTLITINGTPVVHSGNANLFKMLLNTWVGARPPSSDFKRDILNLPRDKAGADLLTRFNAIKPSEARKKLVASWGLKDKEAEAAAVAAAPAPTPTKAKAEPPPPAATPPKADAHKSSAPEKAAAGVAASATAAAPSATVAPAAAAAAEPTPPQPKVDVAAESARRAEQQRLYEQYSNQLRNIVLRNIRYPKRAVKQNREGLVVLKISVSRTGALLSSSVAQSADDLLDSAALKAIENSGQLPAVNAALEGKSFDFMIPVVFKLTSEG